MKFILLILSFFSLSFCQYKKLKKHGSVKVAPETKVYLDLSSFVVGDLISFEIELELFFGGNKNFYEFSIGQVPASSYYDSNYWNSLHRVRNGNASCDDRDKCIFTWEEIKKEGSTYIYIIPPAPFDNYYSFWEKKIKIKNLGGGLSTGEIVGIVFGVIAFIAIFVVLIVCCCCICQKNNGCCLCCACCDCCCCKKMYYGTTIQASIPIQPVYPQPVYPQPVPVVSVTPVAPVTPAYPTPAPAYPITGPVYPQGYNQSQPYTSARVIHI
jgi:hypothetical protein